MYHGQVTVNSSGNEPTDQRAPAQHISTLNEKPLHAALKKWYAQTGDELEVRVDGYIIDVVRGDLLIEIQTQNFSGLKRKLYDLTERHPLRLVHPIAREKWIVKVEKDGHTPINRRKSPKRGSIEHIFDELVSFPALLCNPNFALEVLLVQEDELRRHDSRRGWRRRGWVTLEHQLLQVVDRRLFETPADMSALIPAGLTEPFTTADLANAMSRPRRLAQKMAYCLRGMGVIESVGKKGRAYLYTRVAGNAPRTESEKRVRSAT